MSGNDSYWNSDADFPEDDFDEDEYFDCAMMPDGQCGKAGSEECDWECPVMADIIRQEIKKKAKTKK